jgi:hypothetical protein
MSTEVENYIKENLYNKTDYQMGLYLGYTERTIKNYRLSMKIKRRFNNQRLGKDKIAKILEYFANYTPIIEIARLVGTSYNHTRYVIHKYFFYTQRSYNTITMVMDSKVNYN